MNEEISLTEYLKAVGPKSKFFAKKTEVDNGYWCDSIKEAKRWKELRMLEQTGWIKNLTFHPVFPMIVNEQKICVYEADASYVDIKTGQPVVEDTKSEKTRTLESWRLKRKLFRALYGRDVVEVL